MTAYPPFYKIIYTRTFQSPPIILCRCRAIECPHGKEGCKEPAQPNMINSPEGEGLCAQCQDALQDRVQDS